MLRKDIKNAGLHPAVLRIVGSRRGIPSAYRSQAGTDDPLRFCKIFKKIDIAAIEAARRG